MDAMEKSHELESSVLSALFNARQMLWTQFSSVISDVKQQFECSNKKSNQEVNRLLNENQSLKETLNQYCEILEGKEMEIHGLRRQVQSFLTGVPLCTSCSRRVELSRLDGIAKTRHLPANAVRVDARKRLRVNTSLSSTQDESTVQDAQVDNRIRRTDRENRPSQKRLCSRAASVGHSGALPAVLVPDTEAIDDQAGVSQELREEESQDLDSSLEAGNGEKMKIVPSNQPAGTPEDSRMAVSKLSPPTQSYDASQAIRNAVNHLDLENYENTFLESTSQFTQRDELSTGLLMNLRCTSKAVVRRTVLHQPPSRSQHMVNSLLARRYHIGSSSHRHHHRQHKPTCRHFTHQGPKAADHKKSTKECNNADDTGADLSLPSGFLESERTEVMDPRNCAPSSKNNIPDSNVSLDPPTETDACLPSVGGSPTYDRNVFKRPRNPVRHSQLAQVATTCSNEPLATSTQSPASTTAAHSPMPDSPHPSARTVQNRQIAGIIPNLESPANEGLLGPRVMLQKVPSLTAGDSPDVKCTGPTERRKSARRQLVGYSCPSCKEYYDGMGLTSPEVASRLQLCSRHRARHGAPPSTPKGFWNIDISDSENRLEDPGELNAEGGKLSRNFRRRRPLNFPEHVQSPLHQRDNQNTGMST
ncbi:unnamed protein product [Calicophoron daubneyi]|uniref:DNA endonuclease activator Ctp1 C-terminal domain-containing protein n=1 Tax=Calicophoron daubneyi TaxID=300641 RepID=A0AAV2TMU6_CALDB